MPSETDAGARPLYSGRSRVRVQHAAHAAVSIFVDELVWSDFLENPYRVPGSPALTAQQIVNFAVSKFGRRVAGDAGIWMH